MEVPYQIKLEDVFEGPMDLLLHLIRKNEVDIYDIPVALITRQYLEYLDWMKMMNIDFAGDFLVMASTLAQIKSRTLLPTHGNVQHNLGWYLKGLKPGMYYWSVQSIDSAFAGSPFAEEQSFTIPE
jgi:segregation and condensation protein A